MRRVAAASDYWSNGVEPSRATLDAFLDHHHKQGLSPRRVSIEEVFRPSTYGALSL